MDKVSSRSGVSVSFTGLLFIVFLVLKLTNAIAWSWWWVTAPLWMLPAIALLVALVLVLIAGMVLIMER